MPVRNRRPDDEKPLFRAVNEQRLMGPVRATAESTQNGTATQKESAAPRPAEQAASGGAGSGGAQKGPVSRALDRAEENNWVYSSVADAARRSGIVSKLDQLFS